MHRVDLDLDRGISFETAAEKRVDAQVRLEALDPNHRHQSGFYLGALRVPCVPCWLCCCVCCACCECFRVCVPAFPLRQPLDDEAPAEAPHLCCPPRPAGSQEVVAGGKKRPHHILMAAELGSTMTGAIRMAIHVRDKHRKAPPPRSASLPASALLNSRCAASEVDASERLPNTPAGCFSVPACPPPAAPIHLAAAAQHGRLRCAHAVGAQGQGVQAGV